ncbi:MAG TPA: hypothetical protein VFC93_00125 [Chloroflexota bacterium]|nr:hypothetical protein [Chloroflexota bacterium]
MRPTLRAIAGVVLALALVGGPPRAAAAGCTFQLGFRALHDLIPHVVGDCRADEHHDPATGDGLQETTGGLLVWRKADNFTAFTDGYRTWVNGPFGLQTRLNTERFPWEALPDVAFVLLPGYGSTPAAAALLFAPLQTALAAKGWHAFVPFGYAGGAEVGGAWQPAPYSCPATAGPVTRDVAALAALLAADAAAHPGRRYVLVGHSLGGLVAWSYLAALRSGQTAAAPLAGVVTVDAPLRGIGADKRLAGALGGCGGAVLDELGGLYARADQLAPAWAELAAWAGGRGVKVATVGSGGDCLYFPRMAGCAVPYAELVGSSDDRETQYVPGTAVRLSVPVDPAWPADGPLGRVAPSHTALLADGPLVARVTEVVDGVAR